MSVPTDSNGPNGHEPDEYHVNLGRHRSQCSVCKHPQCQQIEDDWLDWTSPHKIAQDYGVSRDSIYRHCRALRLYSKRRRNLMPAYERIIELGGIVDYTGSNILSALKELAKLVSAEKVVDAAQSADEKPAFQQTTSKESDNGALPGSIAALLDKMPGLEPGQGQNGEKEPQGPEPPSVQ
jgi:hypothetical protein